MPTDDQEACPEPLDEQTATQHRPAESLRPLEGHGQTQERRGQADAVRRKGRCALVDGVVDADQASTLVNTRPMHGVQPMATTRLTRSRSPAARAAQPGSLRT